MMPRSAIATGVADFVEPISGIVRRIAETLQSKLALKHTSEEEAEQQVSRILSFLRARTGHDFTSYKSATVRRRIGAPDAGNAAGELVRICHLPEPDSGRSAGLAGRSAHFGNLVFPRP